jgi:hypothetical protein
MQKIDPGLALRWLSGPHKIELKGRRNMKNPDPASDLDHNTVDSGRCYAERRSKLSAVIGTAQ